MADHKRDQTDPAKATVPPASGDEIPSPMTASQPQHVRFPKTWATWSWSAGAWSVGAWGNGAFK